MCWCSHLTVSFNQACWCYPWVLSTRWWTPGYSAGKSSTLQSYSSTPSKLIIFKINHLLKLSTFKINNLQKLSTFQINHLQKLSTIKIVYLQVIHVQQFIIFKSFIYKKMISVPKKLVIYKNYSPSKIS